MYPTFTTATTTTTTTTLQYHPLDNTAPMNDSLWHSDDNEEGDEDYEDDGQQTPSDNWNDFLSQFNSQPDMIQLIQLCQQEEDKRRQEESSLELKQHLVLRQLQYIHHQHKAVAAKKELQLLPPLPTSDNSKE